MSTLFERHAALLQEYDRQWHLWAAMDFPYLPSWNGGDAYDAARSEYLKFISEHPEFQ